MSYYADVNGHIEFEHMLRQEEMDQITLMFGQEAWYDSEVPDTLDAVDFWTSDNYYYDTDDLLNKIARDYPVKNGRVVCHGEDGEHWKFVFCPGKPHGIFQEISGKIVYDD